MASEAADQELDEDGLVVQKYQSMVLVVVPPEGYGDQTLRYARSSLYNVHVGTHSVSTVSEELIKGRLQDEFMVDYPLAEADMSKYSGILIAGGDGPATLASDAKVLQLVRDAYAAGKLVAAWGNAVEVLVRAGIGKGHRLTGDPALEAAARENGAKFSGRQIEVSKNVVTARDEGAGMRFGQALAEIVRI